MSPRRGCTFPFQKGEAKSLHLGEVLLVGDFFCLMCMWFCLCVREVMGTLHAEKEGGGVTRSWVAGGSWGFVPQVPNLEELLSSQLGFSSL